MLIYTLERSGVKFSTILYNLVTIGLDPAAKSLFFSFLLNVLWVWKVHEVVDAV